MSTTSYTLAHQAAAEATVGLLSARACGEPELAATLLKDYFDELEVEGLDMQTAFSRGWMSAIALLDTVLAASPDPTTARQQLAVDVARMRP